MLPAVSVARTVNVWLPSASPVNVLGDAHAANAPVSSLHVIAPSETVNVNVADALFDGLFGAPVIVTAGGTVSTENDRVALPVLPAASVTRTSNTCAPSASAAVVNGDAHAANAAPSMRQSVAVAAPPVVN